ncbi:ATP-binding protein [Aeromicrobium sp. UC242_57]|uniref:ATP-binding protein n=1 Tax=Aeromicrobium sp. UC242_57 TaxID=3374624 RepID=UPI0037BD6E04
MVPSRPGTVPSGARPGSWSFPVGATEDRVLGSIQLERALSHGKVEYEPGLLAAAHRGLLYVDEVNLLHDHLVDVLLDSAAMGRVTVERDGVSLEYASRFVLVGTMNPEEGRLAAPAPRPVRADRRGRRRARARAAGRGRPPADELRRRPRRGSPLPTPPPTRR